MAHEKYADALSIRFHESTMKLLKHRAALEMRKPSDWVRQLVVKALQTDKGAKP